MKTSSTWNFRYIVGKIMLGLVVAAMIGSADVIPSFGEGNHGRGGKQEGGRNEQRGRGHDRDRNEHGRREYRSHGYRERGYFPPPVVYAPPPAPGISIFFPPVVIRP
jgi:hypothetical protein